MNAAYELGQKAHANGKSAAPAMCPEFMAYLRTVDSGVFGSSIEHSKSFIEGFEAANEAKMKIEFPEMYK